MIDSIINSTLLLWLIFGIIILIILFQFLRYFHNINLLKSVTSLNRGTKSERKLILKLLKKGIHEQTIFHDLYIETNQGKSSQIDLVIATTEGMVVIEVKDYKGWIYGNANYNNWTKVLAYGKRKYRFYNPIKQNISHIKSLKGELKQFEKIPFYSLIVFYGECELKEINYVPKGTFIVKQHRIFDVLKNIKKNNEPAPYIDKLEIIEMLKNSVKNGESKINQNTHIERINDMTGKDRVYD